MVIKRMELTLNENIFQKLEEERIKLGFQDKQDIIYKILRNRYYKKSFFEKLKDFFN